jgi:hypothetical protein
LASNLLNFLSPHVVRSTFLVYQRHCSDSYPVCTWHVILGQNYRISNSLDRFCIVAYKYTFLPLIVSDFRDCSFVFCVSYIFSLYFLSHHTKCRLSVGTQSRQHASTKPKMPQGK